MQNMDDITKQILETTNKHKSMTRASDNIYSFRNNSNYKIPDFEIEEENTADYQIQKHINRIIEKSNEQIKLLVEQNSELKQNNKKLEEFCNLKDAELKETKEEAKKSRIYNRVAIVISTISAIVSIFAWVCPIK